jgi:hypothetical protein
LLPECTTAHVPTLVSRLRPMEIEYGGATIPICFSAGCVGYENGETTEQFLDRADRVLYAEKRAAKKREKDSIADRQMDLGGLAGADAIEPPLSVPVAK